MKKIHIIKNIEDMRALSREYLRKGFSIGLVPTMGALHSGHVSLIEKSIEDNDITIVSIFVNPTQFSPSEDYNSYPRDFEGDVKKLRKFGVDALFAPESREMYPKDFDSFITLERLSEKLCGKFRPGHFRGVATIVAKLFNIVKPSRAYFGQKDYQQGLVIQKMVRDLNLDVQIEICPVVREDDGLAMSSRNAYLGEKERRTAGVIYRALKELSEKLEKGKLNIDNVSEEFKQILSSEHLVKEIQYASGYDPLTLDELKDNNYKGKLLLAVAVKIGTTRLIDNVIIGI